MQAIITSEPGIKTIEIPKTISLGKEIYATVEAIVRDKQGNITDYRRFRSRSFVANFIRLLWLRAAGWNYTTPTLAITDTGGVARNCVTDGADLKCDAGAGVVTHGIVVGTGAAAPTINDTQLGVLIAHGGAPNQLNYSAVTFGAPVNDAATSQFTITRDFANGSGGLITVNECGLYVYGYDVGIKYFMSIRDTTGGIAVPNGQTLTFNYQINATVPGLVKQFIQILYHLHAQAGQSVLDITNTARALVIGANWTDRTLFMCSPPGYDQQIVCSGGEGVQGDALGIQVGSNATAPTANDVALNTKIVHGIAGGQLIYAGSEIEELVVAAPSASFLLRRYFTNKSGGNVDVRETGIYIPAFGATTWRWQFLICRDTPALVTVLNNELLRVQYTIQVTV